MTKLGHRCALLTGELSIEQRAQMINEFKEQMYRVLISTNVTARGEWRLCKSSLCYCCRHRYRRRVHGSQLRSADDRRYVAAQSHRGRRSRNVRDFMSSMMHPLQL